jgi:hypothetical protein
MQNTTPMVPAPEPITFDVLLQVAGGCHPKPPPCPVPAANMQSVNVQNFNFFNFQPAQAIPAQCVAAAPSGGYSVDTNVSYSST